MDPSFELEMWPDQEKGPIDRQSLLSKCKEVDAVITMLSDKIDKEFFDNCKNIKVIAQYAVGYNNIDTSEAKKRNIVVTNTPDVLTDATAELALSLLLSCARKINQASDNVKQNQWKDWEPMGFLGKSLKNTTVAIIGAGRIGQEFARKCHGAFNSDIIYYSRSKKENFEKELNAKKMELNDLLKHADIISLHCPLNDETKELLNYERLLQCKKDAILINTARGEVINQQDLIKVIKMGHFHSVGLDVTTPEPLEGQNPLKSFDNVLICPHIGSATVNTRTEMGTLCARNVKNVLSGLPPETEVNY